MTPGRFDRRLKEKKRIPSVAARLTWAVSSMRLAFDLDDRLCRTWAGQSISALTGKRRDRFLVEVRFTRGGVVQELASGATGILGLKKLNSYTTEYLAEALSWAKSGSGTSTTYTFDLNLNTTAFATEFSGDPSQVAAVLEVEWLVGNFRESSRSMPFNVANDYIRGNEGAATPSQVWRFVQVDEETVRGVAIQVLDANDEWADEVRWVEPKT